MPLLVTALSWGFNFIALKLAYLQLSPAALTFARYLAMGAVLIVLCWSMRLSLRYPQGEVGRLLFLGFLSLGVYIVVFMEGMNATSATDGAILLSTAPVWTAILAVAFRHEKFSLGALLGAIVAFLGVAVVVANRQNGDQGTLVGNGLVLLAALLWAFSAVLMKPVVIKMHPLRALTLSMPGALPILLPYGLMATLEVDWAALSVPTWLSFAHIVLLAGCAGFIGFYAGVRQIGSANAMLYQYFVTPIAAGFAWLVLGERPSWPQGIGVVVVIAGVIWSTSARSRSQVAPAEAA